MTLSKAEQNLVDTIKRVRQELDSAMEAVADEYNDEIPMNLADASMEMFVAMSRIRAHFQTQEMIRGSK